MLTLTLEGLAVSTVEVLGSTLTVQEAVPPLAVLAVMVAVPCLMGVTTPAELTVATEVLLEVQLVTVWPDGVTVAVSRRVSDRE